MNAVDNTMQNALSISRTSGTSHTAVASSTRSTSAALMKPSTVTIVGNLPFAASVAILFRYSAQAFYGSLLDNGLFAKWNSIDNENASKPDVALHSVDDGHNDTSIDKPSDHYTPIPNSLNTFLRTLLRP